MKRTIILIAMIGAIVLTMVGMVVAQGDAEVDDRFVGSIAAPEFPVDADWLNVENPLSVDGLNGKIVLLDFWTYGCINCIHMIPVLAQLEEKYADELVVIGVHSAKFENEGETINISQIVQRYDLHHPVVNDSDFRVWRSYGVRAWPTIALIDPRGNVVAMQAGELPFDALDQYISAMIQYYDDLGTDELNREPLELALEGAGNPGTPLLFPGKVLADEAGNRLFVADTNHHRIVVTDLDTYEVLDVIGTGRRGFDNGGYETATFNQPQGMELVGDTLYVADVNNHAVRAIDLEVKEVTTIAGTGVRGRGTIPTLTPVPALDFELRSPWDVKLGESNTLYIAMAGTHQIWSMDLETGTMMGVVGNGRESLLNSTLVDSELAQPSGLYYTNGELYFADSESSSIRVADIIDDEVRTVSGPAENTLFDFGDIDGVVGTSRLQHALGVTGDMAGTIYIADTYNSRIKTIDPATSVTETIFGLGDNGGYRDGTADVAEFDEPGGLDYANGKLYVADTNNHVLRVIDLETNEVSTIQFPNPERLVIAENEVTILGGNAGSDVLVTLLEQSVAAGEGELTLSLTLPDGFKINDLIDSTINVSSTDESVSVSEPQVVLDEEIVTIPVTFSEGGEATVSLQMELFYCRTGEDSLCFIENVTFEAPVVVANDGGSTVAFERTIVAPDVE